MTPAIARDVETTLARARTAAASAKDGEAKAAYLEILRRDPTHFAALNELAGLAHASGHFSAARTAYRQAIRQHPANPVGHVNLGNMLCDDEAFDTARGHFEAALAADAECAAAHRGLGRVLAEQGDFAASDYHWRRSFQEQAVAIQPSRGSPTALPILLLVSARGGNIPTRYLLDDRIFAVIALYAEYYDPEFPLPPHALVFNAIGDADLCRDALSNARKIVERTAAPVVNPPCRVAQTGRMVNAARLAQIPGVRAPRIDRVARSITGRNIAPQFPLLLRAPGFHTGRHFVAVKSREDFDAAMAGLPGDEVLAIEYLDARAKDGMARKYRVMIIDGKLYPLHLAISSDWKVHYFTADMTDRPEHRAEEHHFLADMTAVLGVRAIEALHRIGESLGLDYAGVDFALNDHGELLLFEANATMVITPPDPNPLWDYRRGAIDHALDAARQMLLQRGKRQKQSAEILSSFKPTARSSGQENFGKADDWPLPCEKPLTRAQARHLP